MYWWKLLIFLQQLQITILNTRAVQKWPTTSPMLQRWWRCYLLDDNSSCMTVSLSVSLVIPQYFLIELKAWMITGAFYGQQEQGLAEYYVEINTLTRSWLQSPSYPVSSCKCPAIKPSCYFPWGGLVEAGARIHASDIFGLMLTGVIRWSENSIICTAVPVVFSLLLLVLLTRTVSLVQQCQWCFCYFY